MRKKCQNYKKTLGTGKQSKLDFLQHKTPQMYISDEKFIPYEITTVFLLREMYEKKKTIDKLLYIQ